MSAFTSCFSTGVALGTLLGAMCIAGCAPEPFTAEQVDVVATRRSESADFEDLRTYALPTTVTDLCNVLAEIPPGGFGGEGGARSAEDVEGCAEPDHSLDDLLLDSLRTELDDLGYQEVESDEDPDIAVLVGIVAQSQLHVWDGVPWCYAHELFRGCWQPNYEYPYNLQYGTVLVDFVLPESSDDELDVVWTAVLSGVARPEADDDRLTSAVETAFDQAPYLEDGGAP